MNNDPRCASAAGARSRGRRGGEDCTARRRAAAGDPRQGTDDRRSRGGAAGAGPCPARGPPRTRQDGARQGLVAPVVADLQADSIHARSAAHRHHRQPHPPGAGRPQGFRLPPRPGFHEPAARRRDQPRLPENTGGSARGDAGTARHHLRRNAAAPRALFRAGHAESHRARGNVSASRSAAGSLHVQDRRCRRRPRRARRDPGEPRPRRAAFARPAADRRGSSGSFCAGRCRTPAAQRRRLHRAAGGGDSSLQRRGAGGGAHVREIWQLPACRHLDRCRVARARAPPRQAQCRLRRRPPRRRAGNRAPPGARLRGAPRRLGRPARSGNIARRGRGPEVERGLPQTLEAR